MCMSGLETWLVNSPFRAWLQRGELRAFRRRAPLAPGGVLLDAGCGRGVSSRLLRGVFRPARVVAFDFEGGQVRRAARELRRHGDVALLQADATRMPFADASFDAAFETGILHHIPHSPDGQVGWRIALPELARVLKPGGLLYFAEPSRGRLTRGLYRFIAHDRAFMFSPDELSEALAVAGLHLEGPLKRLPLWDMVGVARRAE
jgi:ubiquinone/menaquinone biosynthesis C-methylase UbiE